MPQDFRVGLDIGIHGRAIRIYDADEYTRIFFDVSDNLKIETADFFLEPRTALTSGSVVPCRCIH